MKEKNNRKFYDEAFLEIFTNRKIVKSLLQDFIKEEWIELIDFSSMKTEKSVFKGISDSKRESDLLLRFDLNSDAPSLQSTSRTLYIYMLIEFQSKSKPIIMRVFEYLLRIYKKQFKKSRLLYPVIPIVIYNGEESWTEKRNLLDHFTFYNDDLSKYLPVFEYFLIDIARFDDKLLKRLKGAASAFFLLDKTDLTQREKSEKRIVGILKKLIHSNPEIYNLLGRYILELLQYKGVEIPEINDYINDRGESMLAQSMDKLYEQGIEQGIEQGVEQGIEQDKIETARRMLAKGFWECQPNCVNSIIS
jgi:predicted transposase/invertase (TIGR01784 family)